MWDPSGILMPVTMKFRIAMQELWDYDWDDQLSEQETREWQDYRREILPLQDFRIRRCLKPQGAVGLPQLHGFADGGEKAYGACCCLRWNLEDGHYENTFVAAKGLVAPLKKKSIPRLELMACTTMSRLIKSIEAALNIEYTEKYLWVDSTTVLKWLRSSPRSFKPFGSAKVAEVQETHDVRCFRYVPSESNPADQLTKPIPTEQLAEWHKGTAFLLMDEEFWPQEPVCEDPSRGVEENATNKDRSKIKKRQQRQIHSVVRTDTPNDAEK